MKKCHSIIVTGKVQDNFTLTIKLRGRESGAEIEDIKEILLPFNIDLPDEFSRVSSDDDLDLGRKLDKGNEFLKTLPDIKDMLGSFIREQREHNTRLEAMMIGINEHNTRLEAMVLGINEHNTHLEEMIYEQNARLDGHNTRLEAILEKLANK